MSEAKRLTYLTTEPIPYLRNPRATEKESIQAILQQIAECAHAAVEADASSVFLVDEESGRLARQVAGTGYQGRFVHEAERRIVPPKEVIDRPSSLEEKLGIGGWVMSTGLPYLARSPEEHRGHPHHRGDYDKVQVSNETLDIQTSLTLPIRGLHREVRGLIKVERRVEAGKQKLSFSEEDESTLSNIAVAAGRCIDYMKMSLTGQKQEAVAAWTLDVISMASTVEPDPLSFLNIVARVMTSAADAESCSVFLLDEDRRYLSQFGGCGYQARGVFGRSYRLPPKGASEELCEGLTVYIAVSGETVYARNNEELKNHKAWRGKFDKVNFSGGQQCNAFLGVPIRVGATTIGVLKLENGSEKRPVNPDDPFPEDVRRQLNVLVQDLGLALLCLQNKEKRRYKVIETSIPTLNEILRSRGELSALVRGAIEHISKTLHAEACALFVKEGDRLVQRDWGAYGYSSNIPPGKRREYLWVPREDIKELPEKTEDKVGLTVWIASMGRKFIARKHEELVAHPHHKGTFDPENFTEGQRCESFMGVPLTVQNETVGVLKIENKIDPKSSQYIPFSREDELVFDLLASSLANVIYYLRNRPEANRDQFTAGRRSCEDRRKMWALGVKAGQSGLQGFSIDVPPLNDDAVMVRTLSLGICGTDILSFGGNVSSKYDLIEFHEALGEVVWTGQSVDGERIKVGDIVVPVVRRCQAWDPPPDDQADKITFDFRSCKEAPRCSSYRRPDECPNGEYPCVDRKVGYRSRGTGKCHGFGSEFFVDTSEWLVVACSKEEIDRSSNHEELQEFLSRLILVEPLAVVWKMKGKIEQARPVRAFQDRILTLGLGPIGYLATAVMCIMYPGLNSTAIDRIPSTRNWIKGLRGRCKTKYLQLAPDQDWHPELHGENERFDIVIEATGNPQNIIGKAIDVLAPNGILVLLSVVGREGGAAVDLTGDNLNAIVRKNARIVGSVNESREDFVNAIEFLRRFHSGPDSILDPLIDSIELDPGAWQAIRQVEEIRGTERRDRKLGPKIVLVALKPKTPSFA